MSIDASCDPCQGGAHPRQSYRSRTYGLHHLPRTCRKVQHAGLEHSISPPGLIWFGIESEHSSERLWQIHEAENGTAAR